MDAERDEPHQASFVICEKAVEQGTNTKGYRDVGGHATIGETQEPRGGYESDADDVVEDGMNVPGNDFHAMVSRARVDHA